MKTIKNPKLKIQKFGFRTGLLLFCIFNFSFYIAPAHAGILEDMLQALKDIKAAIGLHPPVTPAPVPTPIAKCGPTYCTGAIIKPAVGSGGIKPKATPGGACLVDPNCGTTSSTVGEGTLGTVVDVQAVGTVNYLQTSWPSGVVGWTPDSPGTIAYVSGPKPTTAPPPPPPSPVTPPVVIGPTPTVGDYYVSPSGNDANPGTQAAPFKTLQKAVPLLAPGKTLIVRGGEYDTVNGLTKKDGTSLIPSGESWDKPVIIKAAVGEKVTFRRYLPVGWQYTEEQVRNGIHLATPAECKGQATYPYPCWSGGGNDPGNLPWQADFPGAIFGGVIQMNGGSTKYVVFDGTDLDSRGIVTNAFQTTCLNICDSVASGDDPRHIRFINLELRNSISSCMSQPGLNNADIRSDLQFINVKIHHCGVPYDTHWFNDDPAQGRARENNRAAFYHPWYAHTGGNTLMNSEVYASAGTGLGPDGHDNVIVGNYIHDNSSHGIQFGGGIHWTVSKNVFYNNADCMNFINYGSHTVTHNTCVAGPKGNKFWGVNMGSGVSNVTFQDNLLYGYTVGIQTYSTEPLYNGHTQIKNNLVFNIPAGKEITDTGTNLAVITRNILNVDPMLNADFTLKPGSPAIGKASDGGNIGAK